MFFDFIYFIFFCGMQGNYEVNRSGTSLKVLQSCIASVFCLCLVMSKRRNETESRGGSKKKKRRRRTEDDRRSHSTEDEPRVVDKEVVEVSKISCLRDAIAAKVVEVPEALVGSEKELLKKDPFWKIVLSALENLEKVRLSWLPLKDGAGQCFICFS
jgi:hypothetical protein